MKRKKPKKEENSDPQEKPIKKLEIGDQILLSLVPKERLSEAFFRPLIRLSPLFSICRLNDLLKMIPDFSIEELNLEMKELISDHPWILECLIPNLAKKWAGMEVSKNSIRSPEEMLRLGSFQEAVMASFLSASEEEKRQDLSCLFTEAAWIALGFQTNKFPTPEFWKESLDLTNSSLAQRQRTFKASGTFLNHLKTIKEWFSEFSVIHEWDEEYGLAKACLQSWKIFSTRHEEVGKSWTGFERANFLYEELIKVV
jgi:hypothetical protein